MNFVSGIHEDHGDLYFLCRVSGPCMEGRDVHDEIEAARKSCEGMSPWDLVVSGDDQDFPFMIRVDALGDSSDQGNEWLECIRSYLISRGFRSWTF